MWTIARDDLLLQLRHLERKQKMQAKARARKYCSADFYLRFLGKTLISKQPACFEYERCTVHVTYHKGAWKATMWRQWEKSLTSQYTKPLETKTVISYPGEDVVYEFVFSGPVERSFYFNQLYGVAAEKCPTKHISLAGSPLRSDVFSSKTALKLNNFPLGLIGFNDKQIVISPPLPSEDYHYAK